MAVGLFQPAPNPAPNPGGFAQAAAGIFDTIQQVGAAAQRQHAQFQQQALKDQFETELKMRKDGYTPYMNTTSADASGLKRREAQQVDPSRVVVDHFGRRWVAPEAKPETTPQQTFSDTTSLLEKGARPVGPDGNVAQDQQIPRLSMDLNGAISDTGRYGINAPPPAGTTVTPPGGKQAYFVPGEEETAGLKARFDAQAAAAKPGAPHIDTEHFTSPVMIDGKSGKATPIELPAGVTHNEKPGKSYTYHYSTDDSGTVHVLRGDPETGDVSEVKAIKGAGAKRKDPDAAAAERTLTPGQKQVQDRFNVRELRTANTQKHSRLAKAESDFAKDLKDAGPDPNKVQAAKDRLWTAKQAAQDEYEAGLQDLGLNPGHFDFASQRRQMSQPANGGGRGAPQQTVQKKGPLTDMSIVNQYLQKAGGDRNKARQLARTDGWEF